MAVGLIVAIVSGALAVVANAIAVLVNRRDGQLQVRLAVAERELERCADRCMELRRNEQLVLGALLGMLPTRKRLELLQALGESIDDEQAAY